MKGASQMLERYQIIDNLIVKSENGNILYYYAIDESEKQKIADEFSVDLHTIGSALDADEIPRLETENDKMVLIWKFPSAFKLGDLSSFNISSIGFFLIKDKLIIISLKNNNYFKEKSSLLIKSLIDVILFFQNNTIKHFIEHLKIIRLMSREIQEKINKAMENKYLLQMFNLSEILVYYLDAINGNKTVLNKFKEYLKGNNFNANIDFLNDVIIESEQAAKQAEIYTAIFSGLMDARGTIVNNNMNVLIKNLTIINIIFLPLNLIASILGMSEFSMMTQGIDWRISYSLFGIAMVIIGLFTLFVLNRLKIK